MAEMYRHIGKVVNTDARCIVAWMLIPGHDDRALIINLDSLPPHYDQPIRRLLESPEGQAANNFGDILSRALMPHSSMRIIDGLHNAGLLVPMHIDNVVMTPRPSMAFPLRKVLVEMKALKVDATPTQDFGIDKFNPHLHNRNVRSVEERIGIARGLLAEAADLNGIAAKKSEEAYLMAPELRPSAAPQLDTSWQTPERLPLAEVADAEGPIMEVDPPKMVELNLDTPNAANLEWLAAVMSGEVDAPPPPPPPPVLTEASAAPKKTSAKTAKPTKRAKAPKA